MIIINVTIKYGREHNGAWSMMYEYDIETI